MSILLSPELNSIFEEVVVLKEEESNNSSVVNELSKVLANSYFLYLKTQNFHWNVTGPMFKDLHDIFQGQYTDLAGAIDLIAEQIRILGSVAPGSFQQFSNLTSIKEETGVPSANEMITSLISDNETVVSNLKSLISVSNSSSDDATADIAIERIRVHTKAIWFLKSML